MKAMRTVPNGYFISANELQTMFWSLAQQHQFRYETMESVCDLASQPDANHKLKLAFVASVEDFKEVSRLLDAVYQAIEKKVADGEVRDEDAMNIRTRMKFHKNLIPLKLTPQESEDKISETPVLDMIAAYERA